MGRLIWILLAVFLAGLGMVIGTRMSVEAMGVVVGVVLGVAASIPMTLLLAHFLLSERKAEQPQEDQPPVPTFIVMRRGRDETTAILDSPTGRAIEESMLQQGWRFVGYSQKERQ
jgi:hypothetical protein